MRPDLRLDYAIFQLTPTRTRCELYVSVGGRMVKLAAGLVKPFVTHLQVLEDQMANGGYSIRLEPPDPNLASWFTTGTMERFVRFVSTPEVLERVSTVEKELMQLEATKNNRAEESTPVDEKSAKNALVVYTPGVNMAAPVTSPSSDKPLLTKTRQDSLEVTEKEDGENGRKRLLRALDARQAMLQKEQGMTFARAAAAGFTIDNMADLVVFAECFGASRLRDACLKFIELCKKRQEAGLWQEDMELIAAESALARGDMNGGGDHRGDNAGIDLLQRQGSLDSSADPSNLPSKAIGEEGFTTAPPTQRYSEGFHHLGDQGPYGMAWQDKGMHGHPHVMHGVMPSYMQQGYGYGDVRRAPHFGQPQYYGQPGNAPRWWGSDAHSMPPPPYFPPPHQQRYYGDMPHPEAYGDYLHSMQSSTMNGEYPYKLPTNAVLESQPAPSPRKEEISSESVDSMNSSSAKPGSIEASTQVKDKSRSEDVNSFDHTDPSPGEPVGSRRSSRRSPSPRRSSSPMRRTHLGRSGHRKSGMVVIRNINYIAPSQVQEKEAQSESSDSWSEEGDSAIASGDDDSSQSEAGNVRTRVQDVIGLFENPSKSLHSKKKSSSKRGSRKESSKKDDQKGSDINGTNTSAVGCEKEDEHLPVGVDEVACLRGSNSNKDMAFVADKRQSSSSQVDRTLDFDSETLSYKQNTITEEDPMVLGFEGGEVKTSSQKSQTLCLSDLEANNLPHGIADEVLLFSEKNEIRTKSTTFSGPEVIAEQECGVGSIPKPTGDDFFVVSKFTDSASRTDMGSRLADFDPEAMIGASSNDGLKKMNRGLPDDSFIYSSRNTELEQGTAVRRADVMVEAELSGNGNTNQNSENAIVSDEKASESFGPDDLYMIPDRHFVRDSIDNSRSAVVDYDFQMLMNMAENETSSLDQDNENAPILEEEDKDMDENVDVSGKGGDLKKSEREAKVNGMRNALEKKKTDVTKNSRNGKLSPLAEAQARAEKLRAYKARLQKSKKEKEEEERNRIEQLKIQRRERIAARTVSTTTTTNTQVSSATNSPRGVKPQAIVAIKSNSSSSRRSSLERLTSNSNNRIKATTVSSSPSAKTVQVLHTNGNGSTHSAKVQKSAKTSENLLLKSSLLLTENGKEIGRSSSLRGSTGSLKVSKQGVVVNHSKSMTEASTLRRQSLPEALTGKVVKGETLRIDSKQPKTPDNSEATEFSSIQNVPVSNGSTVVVSETKSEEATKKERGQRITLEYVPPTPLESTSDCFRTETSLPTELSPRNDDEETKMDSERAFEATERDFASGISEYKDDQVPLALVSEPNIDCPIALTSQPSVTNDISLVEVENKEETQCSPVIITSKPQPSISIKEESEPISFLSTPKDANYLAVPLNSDLVHVAEKYHAPIARVSDPSLDFSPSDNGSSPVFVVDSTNKNVVSDRSGNLISAKSDSMDSSITQLGKKSEISEKLTKEKTHAKGFRRLLKFGRKSKSGVSSSSSTSEDDVGAEIMTETSLESPEDVNSRVLTSIDEDSPVTFPTSKHHDRNAQNTAVGSKGGNGVATLSQMISQDEHSQPKGAHSFFSLTGFRSKGSESKSR